MRRILVAIVCAFAAMDASSAPASKVKRHIGGIKGEFIVVLNERTPTDAVEGLARSIARTYGVKVDTVWSYSLRGFLARGSDHALDRMADDPRIDYIEQNVLTSMKPQENVAAPEPFTPTTSATQYTWVNDPSRGWQYMWFLDRLDEPSYAQRDGTHNMCTEGRSVYAYIIDTGIWANHPEFENPTRVVRRVDFSADRTNPNLVWTPDATDGCAARANVWHGTAVASNLAGTTIGSAKTQIVSLKVFSCDFVINTADFIDALEWIASPATNPYRYQPGVINHSGFVPVWDGNFTAYGDAVTRTIPTLNMPFFTSADNLAADACMFAPNDRAYTKSNRNGTVFVVGGTSTSGVETDNNDYRWQRWRHDGLPVIGTGSGSNAGRCISAYAPANSIYSARNNRVVGAWPYDWAAGTSFASPLTAGIAARYMERQRNLTGVTPGYRQVYDWLLAQATTPVLHTTSPGYWMCVLPGANGGYTEAAYRTHPGQCPGTNWWGPTWMGSGDNTSDARMIYWDEGTCW